MSDARVARVLMSGDTVGGVWTFTLELAAALERSGVEVVLAAMGGAPSPEQRAEAARIPNLRVLESGYKLEWMEEPWADVEASARWLLKLEDEYAPDVVHLNSYGHGALEWQTPVVITAHSCVLSWWEAVKREPAPASWERYRREVKRSLDCADCVTAPSRAMARAVKQFYNVSCRVVPNGRNEERFAQGPKEPFILTAGRLWDEGKNAAAVARASEGLEWPVYVAGECGTAEVAGCRALGRLGADELAGWYARASIYAAPARYEPFGLSVLEAALSGCALVLSDIDSLREIWDGAAVFVPAEDAQALHTELRALIRDDVQRSSLARRALRRGCEYTPARMAQEYLELYTALAAAGRRVCAS